MTERLALRAQNVHWREIGGEVVILDGRAKRYLALNRSGAELWHLLAAGTTRCELVSHLTAAYGIGAEQAGIDVDRLLDALAARSLLDAPTSRSG